MGEDHPSVHRNLTQTEPRQILTQRINIGHALASRIELRDHVGAATFAFEPVGPFVREIAGLVKDSEHQRTGRSNHHTINITQTTPPDFPNNPVPSVHSPPNTTT